MGAGVWWSKLSPLGARVIVHAVPPGPVGQPFATPWQMMAPFSSPQPFANPYAFQQQQPRMAVGPSISMGNSLGYPSFQEMPNAQPWRPAPPREDPFAILPPALALDPETRYKMNNGSQPPLSLLTIQHALNSQIFHDVLGQNGLYIARIGDFSYRF